MVIQEKEAEIITQYIIGIKPSHLSKELYKKAVKIIKIHTSGRDQRIWDYALEHPLLLPYVDAGLALIEPASPIRQKIYIMFAILETEPSYSNFFIYKKSTFWIISASWFGLRALFRAIAGFFIIKLLILL